MAFECVLQAWHDHQTELRGFLTGQLNEPALTGGHRLREALAQRCDVMLDGSGNVCCHGEPDGSKC